ncbi:hypothetical protein QVD17_19426 [Tagetes erecta]|uniref:Uncharacterized protein n=1 Tax=Tagetes erecta TaxID=13708 RepID=A0AAD8NWY1_TARER|nr:hypothetical protein QVD17_19426 [Tagetes erecta]
MSNSVADQGPPPLPHRRPRVREVSSRFMSPVSSAGDLHSLTMKSPKHSLSTPAPDRSSKQPSQRRLVLRSQPPEPFSSSSENIPDTARSMETPFQYAKPESQRKQRGSSVKENGFVDQIHVSKSSSLRTSKSSRPDTPSDRIVPSRYRQPVTDAAKLMQSTGLSFSGSVSQDLIETEIKGGSCPNSPVSSQNAPDETLTSNRLLLRSTSCQTSLSTPSLCTRSLNLQHTSFKTIDTSHCKVGSAATALPPQPTGAKLGVDSKKGKKPQRSEQDIHSLKLLHNRYLQWRFANAKAQASMNAQTTEMENQFFSIGADISHLRDTVKRKQVELAILRRTNALSTILEAQMPYLDKWSDLEEDYTKSLSGVITALTNSLLRLPINGNVQVNVKDAAEALDSAVKTTDMIVNQMQIFLPKAEEMDGLMSELANVIDVEKALVEECGNLLSKTNTLQVEDCSLRGHLMQVTCSRTINKDTFVG